jgi:hypothetical protein
MIIKTKSKPSTRIDVFFPSFGIEMLASRTGISKSKGMPSSVLLLCVFPFLGFSFNRSFATMQTNACSKDAAYECLRSSRLSVSASRSKVLPPMSAGQR